MNKQHCVTFRSPHHFISANNIDERVKLLILAGGTVVDLVRVNWWVDLRKRLEATGYSDNEHCQPQASILHLT